MNSAGREGLNHDRFGEGDEMRTLIVNAPLALGGTDYDVFAAAAETHALKVVLQAVPAGIEHKDHRGAPLAAPVHA